MWYKIRRIELDNRGELCWQSKRAEEFVTTQKLRVGGMYFLRPGKLYRVEEQTREGCA